MDKDCLCYCIVIVLYHPKSDFSAKISDLESSVSASIILIDNTPGGSEVCNSVSDRVIYVSLGNNNGIAKAQNRGLEIAGSKKADYVLFFDQDSSFQTMNIQMFIEISRFHNLSIASPKIIDVQTGQMLPAQRLNGLGLARSLQAERMKNRDFELCDQQRSFHGGTHVDVMGCCIAVTIT